MTKLEADFSNFNLNWSEKAEKSFSTLDIKKKAKTSKIIKFLSENPRHPSLNTYKIGKLCKLNGSNCEILEAYIENNTPNAWRVLFCMVQNHYIYIYDVVPHL